MKKVLGAAMVAIPFLMLFGASVMELGIATALVVWTMLIGLVVWIYVGVSLLMEL